MWFNDQTAEWLSAISGTGDTTLRLAAEYRSFVAVAASLSWSESDEVGQLGRSSLLGADTVAYQPLHRTQVAITSVPPSTT
jgi:hypothetical protein